MCHGQELTINVVDDLSKIFDSYSMLWCDKYCPKNVSEFRGNRYQLKECMKYMENSKKPILVISGPIGVGKTLMARLMFEQYQYDRIEFSVGNVRS